MVLLCLGRRRCGIRGIVGTRLSFFGKGNPPMFGGQRRLRISFPGDGLKFNMLQLHGLRIR